MWSKPVSYTHLDVYKRQPLHPLAGAAEFGMVELRHAAMAVDDGFEHVQYGRRTESVPLRQIINRLLSGGGKGSHCEAPSYQLAIRWKWRGSAA